MTCQEAFEILCKKENNNLIKVRGCLDFGTFFLFNLAPMYIDNSENYETGTEFDAVDKKTGRVFTYDITSDPDAFINAKEVSAKSLFDVKISDL